MPLMLDLGQLCAGKLRDEPSPAFVVYNRETKKQEARISCVAVDTSGQKTKVLVCMDPLVLRSYQAAHGSVKPGDPLQINVIKKKFEAARREYGGDYAYAVLTTDTLSRAPSAQAAAQAKPQPQPQEESTPE